MSPADDPNNDTLDALGWGDTDDTYATATDPIAAAPDEYVGDFE